MMTVLYIAGEIEFFCLNLTESAFKVHKVTFPFVICLMLYFVAVFPFISECTV